jgi:hypothetical protein
MTWLISNALERAYESSHCSQAPAGEYSVDTSSAGALYAPLNETPIARPFWRRDKMMVSWPHTLFGRTWRHLTDDHGEALLRWYREGFRAPTYRAPGREKVSTDRNQGFGGKWQESSVKFDRNSSSWKTHRCLFGEVLPESSVTLPRWGMIRGGVVYRRQTSERPISATGYGYLATPTSTRNQLSPSMAKWPGCKALLPTPINNTGPSKDKKNLSLDGYAEMFPTPIATTYGTNKGGAAGRTGKERMSLQTLASRNQWPTPIASDAKGSLGAKRGDGNPKTHLAREAASCGQLNPTWVEWLMGWPTEWTALEPLEMAKFQEWRRQHGGF